MQHTPASLKKVNRRNVLDMREELLAPTFATAQRTAACTPAQRTCPSRFPTGFYIHILALPRHYSLESPRPPPSLLAQAVLSLLCNSGAVLSCSSSSFTHIRQSFAFLTHAQASNLPASGTSKHGLLHGVAPLPSPHTPTWKPLVQQKLKPGCSENSALLASPRSVSAVISPPPLPALLAPQTSSPQQVGRWTLAHLSLGHPSPGQHLFCISSKSKHRCQS